MNEIIKNIEAAHINLARQYLTIGVNGLVEAAEFLGVPINDNDDYVGFVQGVLGLIERYNKKYRSKELMFNCEMGFSITSSKYFWTAS